MSPSLVLPLSILLHLWSFSNANETFISAVGDPGMKNPNVRIAFEAWNFCNEVGFEAPHMGSPRLADCTDLYCPNIQGIYLDFSYSDSQFILLF